MAAVAEVHAWQSPACLQDLECMDETVIMLAAYHSPLITKLEITLTCCSQLFSCSPHS